MSDSDGCQSPVCDRPKAAAISNEIPVGPNRRLSGSLQSALPGVQSALPGVQSALPGVPSAKLGNSTFKPSCETLEPASNGYDSASDDSPQGCKSDVSFRPKIHIEHCHETAGEVVATGERHVLRDCFIRDQEGVDQDEPTTNWSNRQLSNHQQLANLQQLATAILQRIRKRLPGRVRLLSVHVHNDAIVLIGQCSTYYSKQMAQHVAMGVLDYQKLVNNISVRPES